MSEPTPVRKSYSPSFVLTVFAILLAVDQAIKAYVRGSLDLYQSTHGPWPGIFEITLTYNRGIAFGLAQGGGVFFAPVALLITGLCFRYCFKNPRETLLTQCSMAMLASGAVGNLIDRLWLGKVTDMFWLRIIDFPVFNFADACITTGAILLSIRFLFEPKPKVNAEGVVV
ncbi:MAG: signal peptidase II [Chthonomonas sp.]|nr:signal peptidase II [Chthonomonas sp.]